VSTRRVVLPGVVIGVIALALAAVFAIALPRITGENGALTLPDRLPGGYTATDLEKAYTGAPNATADQISRSAATERSARAYGDRTMKAAGVKGVTRTYISKDFNDFVIVQAVRARGGALVPYTFTNLEGQQAGSQVQRLVEKDGAECIQFGTTDGKNGLQVGYSQCQKSQGDVTVQVTAQSALGDIVAVADDLLAELA
jgi:hypothetical protein